MATVGIVGGLGPESTIDYYRRILEGWKREDPSTSPSIVIDSLDVQRGLHLVEHDRPALVEYLSASLRRLAGAGADFAAMAANTLHVVYDELQALANRLGASPRTARTSRGRARALPATSSSSQRRSMISRRSARRTRRVVPKPPRERSDEG